MQNISPRLKETTRNKGSASAPLAPKHPLWPRSLTEASRKCGHKAPRSSPHRFARTVEYAREQLEGCHQESIYGMQYFLLEEWARLASALKYHWSHRCEKYLPESRRTTRKQRHINGNLGRQTPDVPQEPHGRLTEMRAQSVPLSQNSISCTS